MATTTFNTRISLKYDTYAQWVEKDPQLLVGEVAVVVVPAETGAVAKEPAVLFKVGDGAHKFSELQFTAGLAADVYDWAKAASKPTYSANEIDGLSDYISGEIQDTDTQYKLEVDADNSRKFHLYSQAKGTSTWNLVSTITIPAQTDYTVTVTPSTPDGVAKRYNIKQTATNLDVNIDIPKDMVVESGTVETKAEAGAWGEAGTYLHLVLANATEDNIYINVGSLIEYVTSGSKVGDQIVIDVSADHKVTATLTEGSVTLAQLHADVQTAIGKAHSHTNKAELDKIVTGDKAKWDAAEQKAHEHGNKTILDAISQDKVDAWDGAVTKQHEHANKTVLDGISAEKVADWDSKAAGNHEHDITELKQASGYIVFNCGSASVNI
jgi:hypothetical protein